jgi:hypothetical protein
MDASRSPYHQATNALNKIQLALQILDRQTLLPPVERQLVTTALQAATELARLLNNNAEQVLRHEQPPTTP